MEDLIERANQGDIKAIRTIAHYYFDDNHPENRDIDKSIDWYLKGAEFGDTECMYLASILLGINAHALRKIGGSSCADDALSCLNRGIYWLEKALQDKGNNDPAFIEEIKTLNGEKGINLYLKSLSTNLKEEKISFLREAIILMKEDYLTPNHDDVPKYLAYSIHALCMEVDDFSEIPEVDRRLQFTLLKKHTESNKDSSDNKGVSFYYLGISYTLGIGTHVDYEKAVECYNTATQLNFDCTEMLKYFKKKLFGGWTYIG